MKILLGMVECEVCPRCVKMWFCASLGGNDGEETGVCGEYESVNVEEK